MTIYSVKPLFQKTLMPMANLMIRLKIHPTAINISALVTSVIAGLLFPFISNLRFLMFVIPLLLFIRIAFNALDGIVARGLGVSSPKGEIYNEFIDRISDSAIFLGLLTIFIKDFNFLKLNDGFMIRYQFIFGIIFIILFLLNSYLGILAKAAGKERLYIGFIGKADRMFYLGLATLIFFFYENMIVWTIFYIFVILGTIISIGQRLWKAVK